VVVVVVLSFVRMNHSPVRVRTLRGPQREVTLLSRAPARAARDPVLAVTRRRPVGRATRRREEALTQSEPEMVSSQAEERRDGHSACPERL